MLALAFIFFLVTMASDSEFTADESTGVLSLGVGTAELFESGSSSPSRPKESFPFATTLRFFLSDDCGVEALYLGNQLRLRQGLKQKCLPILGGTGA